MNNKRMVFLGLGVVILVGVLALGVGTTFAQGGPGIQGHGGHGAGGQGIGSMTPGMAEPLADGTGWQSGGQRGQRMNAHANMQAGSYGDGMLFPGTAPVTGEELPDEVVEALLAGLNDEYHAYAVYQAVIDQFGPVTPFVQIQSAEANHIAALQNIFTRYGLDIPEPQPLTDDLSFDSVADACALGAEAEIANFELYDQWIDAVSDYPDMVQVFTALRNASEYNHLPAFQSCAG